MIVRGEPISSQDLLLPVVNVGSNKRPTYLPSHLCMVMEGQISNLKLDKAQTQKMINFAVRDPNLNANSITTKGFTTLGFENNDRLVALPSSNNSREAYELTKLGTLWSSREEEYGTTLWPRAIAAKSLIPKEASVGSKIKILETGYSVVPKAYGIGQLGLFKDHRKFARRRDDLRGTMPQTTYNIFVPSRNERHQS